MVNKKDSSAVKKKSDIVFSLLMRYIPYILLTLGVMIVFLFAIERLTISFGTPCGAINPEFPYSDSCNCIGNREFICSNTDCSSLEIKCLGIVSSCKREYLRHDIPEKERDCSISIDTILE